MGTNLVRALLCHGQTVCVTDLRPPLDLPKPGLSWIKADVRNRDALRHAFKGADVIFHLAAVISLAGGLRGMVESVNVGGVRAVAETALAARVRRVVHVSSVHAYDLPASPGQVIDENSPPAHAPRLPTYDRSKAKGEAELLRIAQRELEVVIVNPTAILGPDDYGPSRIGMVLRALWHRRLPAVIEGGFDWIDVRDVVASVLAAQTCGQAGGRYLLPGHRRSLRDLIDLAATIGGVPAPPLTVPQWLARTCAPLATGLGRHWRGAPLPTCDVVRTLRTFPYVSGAKAAGELNHRARPLETTLRELHSSLMHRDSS